MDLAKKLSPDGEYVAVIDESNHMVAENEKKEPASCHLYYEQARHAADLSNAEFDKNKVPRRIYGSAAF